MFDVRFPTHRRGFLGRIAAGAAAAGLSGLVAPLGLVAETRPADDPAFEAWLNKITGKHKQMFDAPEVNGGLGLIWARVFLNTANETYATTDADNTAVVVLRHFAAPLALGDAMWAKYKFGDMLKLTDARTSAPAVRNTFAHQLPAEQLIPASGVDDLLAKGVLIGVCNVALTVIAGMVAKAAGAPATGDSVKRDFLANLIPGVQVVPSGVLAVNRTQEKGCTYCFAG
ncbi:MAG TPA: hypothetical protein VI160_11820 [Gemmatimonadales bacterium]